MIDSLLRRSQAGVTAVELMIVLAIGAILAAATMPFFGATIERYRAVGVANDLLRSFSLARAQALATGDRAVVAPLADGNWRSGWRIFLDPNNNGVFDAGDTALQVFPAMPDEMAAAGSAGFAVDGGQFLSFNAMGQPRALNGTTFTDARLQITLGATVRAVCIDARGRSSVVHSTNCP